MRCAKSTYEQEMTKNLNHIELLGDNICHDLIYYNIQRWSKIYFKYHSCYNSIDNNMAECLFMNFGVKEQDYITILKEIRVKVIRIIWQLREFADTWITDIFLMTLKVFQGNTSKSIMWSLEWNSEFDFEVKNS